MADINKKPESLGKPPVWAGTRQALCDALPYYKAHQSSAHTNKNTVVGFLLGGFPTVRDRMDTEVIITTLGGGRERGADGNMIRVRESKERNWSSAEASMMEAMPVGVILDDKYPDLSIATEHKYNVMAFFTITDLWSEKDANGQLFHKIRLEKIDRSTPSWWQAKAEVQHTVNPREFTASHYSATLAWCIDCHQHCKTVFSAGWTCLNRKCKKFFTFPAGVDVACLDYSESFLQERTSFQLPEQPLRPDLPSMEGCLGTESEMRKGIVCPQCHGCSRRIDWTHWAYENPVCNFVLMAKPAAFPLQNVLQEEARVKRILGQGSRLFDAGILQHHAQINGCPVEQFLLPDPSDSSKIIGSVSIIRTNQEINAQPGGPDEMWKISNESVETFDLSRNSVVHAGLPTEKLTRNFLQNWGAPYKFVVAVDSKPFSEAPEAFIGALKRMEWAGRLTRDPSITADFTNFNELLSIGYMEEDKIGFHDDGEDTLGPTVATLSLGSPAIMFFAKKTKNAKRTKKTKKDEEYRPVVLKFPLYHGDIVVMHGSRIHEKYLHKVDPKGKRRFALTCRNIDLTHPSFTPQARDDAIEKSTIPSVSQVWDYPKPDDSKEIQTKFCRICLTTDLKQPAEARNCVVRSKNKTKTVAGGRAMTTTAPASPLPGAKTPAEKSDIPKHRITRSRTTKRSVADSDDSYSEAPHTRAVKKRRTKA
ncbi:hypothetical protein BDP55DRAFT_538712 [Colletotrichum godetiae]|uniref:Fe2OG dioxygenase domain-containing protein n=1 Tax=Colletotrichum godetiae TaxID=1209918 RepID=A0AAJ0F0J7_9PEZI|nr:uncharacterized protein BDP55DRAFT_538712 [Colletotrichum godetiae]KAK1701265.1 hypothetical protein BDP55DRAFT_538712 [Colletotrichum godetiae]